MPGIFNQIGDALSGKSAGPVQPSPTVPSTKVGNADFSALARGRDAEMARQKASASGQSGIDTAMSNHADKVHPVAPRVRPDLGEIAG